MASASRPDVVSRRWQAAHAMANGRIEGGGLDDEIEDSILDPRSRWQQTGMPGDLQARRAVHDDAVEPGDMAARGNSDMDERTLPVGDLEQLGGRLVADDSLRACSEERSPEQRFPRRFTGEHVVDAAPQELPAFRAD